MSKVNLDALIPREDFEVEDVISSGKKKEAISIEDIKNDSFFFTNLRKPDFQRETNEWEPEKVAELVRSFVSGDLIPAIILWRSSGGYLFVIDGSHRLSALAAWVNDDYGDGMASKLFYDGIVPDEQLEVADTTRKLVERTVGPYTDFRLALTNPTKVKSEIVQFAKNLGALAIQLQWVEGDARKAEQSFFKINQQAAPIDKTELRLLEDRRKPTSIAARAIIRSGKGHKYWSNFAAVRQDEIQKLAAEINQILFTPPLQNPIKTLDLPLAGKLYSGQTLPLVVDMISIVVEDTAKGEDDSSGEKTIAVLKKVRRIAYALNSTHASSLGLHPAVYFYSQEGRYKSSAFLAMVNFVAKLIQSNHINEFVDVRREFERFILEYDYLAQQINRKHRTAQRSYPYVSNFFEHVVEGLRRAEKDTAIIKKIRKLEEFNFITDQRPPIRKGKAGEKFTGEAKSAIYLREVLQGAPRCKICGAAVHRNAISIDHVHRRAEGGTDDLGNGQLTHPYCNTGYKH
ncbi:DUF262 domain-containing protein [Variovorax sp. VaC1]|uniref:GmrSD restriction endonuclease domain-containing protein n=1 Tax=Variovorax sp. VaC1 TaxID=3373132 RepID=UPI003748B180